MNKSVISWCRGEEKRNAMQPGCLSQRRESVDERAKVILLWGTGKRDQVVIFLFHDVLPKGGIAEAVDG